MTDRIRKFLIFSLNDLHYALDLAQVAEVGDPPRMFPIPLAPPFYSGALNFHGDIVAVMNLPLFLGQTNFTKSGKVIVLQQEVASLAFLVDKVIRIVSEDEVSFGHAPEIGYAAAILGLSDGKAILLDLEALVLEAATSMQSKR